MASGGPELTTSMRPRVDVGVVTWNTAELTSQALRRLVEVDHGCDLRLLVHDNASSDGTPDALSAAVPQAEVVRGQRNLGFARAVNLLLARSDAPWFLALNSDAWPEPGAIGALLRTAESRPRAGAVAARLVRPDGVLEHSTHPFPTVGLALVDALGLRARLPRRWAERRMLQGAWDHDRPRQVDWAVGAALLLRRQAVAEVGDFDERFFMYVEDLEWCHRAGRHGWETWFEPTAVVRHVGNASGARRFGERRAALEAANLRTFTDEALGPRRAALYRFLETAALSRQWLEARARGADDAGHWRLQLRAALGFVPPPALDDAVEHPGQGAHRGDHVEVAVVVPTCDRPDRLERLLAALAKQDLATDRYEVIVVDDASVRDNSPVLDAASASGRLRLRRLRTDRRRGPAAARNLGWRASNAPVIAFTDDDCLPSPGWLAAGLAAHGGGARVVVGRTTAPPEQAELARRPFARALEVGSARFFETCNAFYRRGDLEAVGGFDERFRRPSGEDTHLGLRVAELGVEPVFAPDALVHHDVRVGGLRAALTETVRWADLPLALKGRPYARRDRIVGLVFWRRAHPRALLLVAGLALAPWWRPAALAALPWSWYRVRRDPVCHGPLLRIAMLPGALALDLTEVVTMTRGSIRHRTVLL